MERGGEPQEEGKSNQKRPCVSKRIRFLSLGIWTETGGGLGAHQAFSPAPSVWPSWTRLS